MPLTLRISFSSGPDTTILAMNDLNNQVYFWQFNRQPTAFAFDPNNDIVLKQGTTTAGTVGITAHNEEVPGVFSLGQNYPNPFNPVTNIRFDIPKRANVEISVYDITGRIVRTVFNGVSDPGRYTADFDGTNISSGVYYYEIRATEIATGKIFRDVKKMIMIK